MKNLKLTLASVWILSLSLLPENSLSAQEAYNVFDIVKQDSRELENLGPFIVQGKVGTTINLAGLSLFSIQDTQLEKYRMLVTTPYRTLPAKQEDIINIKVKLVRELRVGARRELIFKEVD